MKSKSEEELLSEIDELEGWAVEEDQLVKSFRLKNFREAMAALFRVAFEAEALNHHPEVTNTYNRLTFRLCTHDAGNVVTAKDVELARRIDRVVDGGSPSP